MNFSAGEVVQLASGGPLLTVASDVELGRYHDPKNVSVLFDWFDAEGNRHRDSLPATSLRKIEKDSDGENSNEKGSDTTSKQIGEIRRMRGIL
jgi:uncharacterized protein YodC (DUF2158 family)